MIEGFYSISFRGRFDWGTAVLVMYRGIVAGVDVGGVTYDGFYETEGDFVKVILTLTVPPGTTLVQGVPPKSTQYSFKLETKIDLKLWSQQNAVLVQTVFGQVNVVFRKIRNFPKA